MKEVTKIFVYTKGIILLSFLISSVLSGLTALSLEVFTPVNGMEAAFKVFITYMFCCIVIFTACVLLYNCNPTLWKEVKNARSKDIENRSLNYILLAFVPNIKVIHDFLWEIGANTLKGD